MDIPADLQVSISRYDSLGRWDRAELGRALRRLGLSYGEIREQIPVPKGTLSGWCREIRLSQDQAVAIKERTGSQIGVPRDTQWKRRLEVERIQTEARVFALNSLPDPLWVAGTVLYWGEGSKTTRKLELANADPRALRLFMSWTERYLDPQPSFVAALNLHAGNNEPAARRAWQTELGLGPADFTKSYVKPDGTGHRKNHLPHGVCRLRLRKGTDAFYQAMSWVHTLAEAWGSDVPTGELTSLPGR